MEGGGNRRLHPEKHRKADAQKSALISQIVHQEFFNIFAILIHVESPVKKVFVIMTLL
jgi:hypothetical protein